MTQFTVSSPEMYVMFSTWVGWCSANIPALHIYRVLYFRLLTMNEKRGTFLKAFFFLMLFWFKNSRSVFFKHYRILFSSYLSLSLSLSIFLPRGNTSIAFIDEERKESKHQATKLMRDRLTQELSKSKTNYPSWCRWSRSTGKQCGAVAGAFHVPVPIPLAYTAVICRSVGNHTSSLWPQALPSESFSGLQGHT